MRCDWSGVLSTLSGVSIRDKNIVIMIFRYSLRACFDARCVCEVSHGLEARPYVHRSHINPNRPATASNTIANPNKKFLPVFTKGPPTRDRLNITRLARKSRIANHESIPGNAILKVWKYKSESCARPHSSHSLWLRLCARGCVVRRGKVRCCLDVHLRDARVDECVCLGGTL